MDYIPYLNQVMEKRDDRKERWKNVSLIDGRVKGFSLIEERNERNERAFITAFITPNRRDSTYSYQQASNQNHS